MLLKLVRPTKEDIIFQRHRIFDALDRYIFYKDSPEGVELYKIDENGRETHRLVFEWQEIPKLT